jgi:hypothetical protein
MPKEKKTSAAGETGESGHPEIHGEDFQFVLKQLLASFQPILEEELKRAKEPGKAEEGGAGSREDETALASRIFDRFLTEEVAARLLPEEERKRLGPAEEWRWCLRHIRCCAIFGWLVCRGPRTFRAFVYYVHRYWLCVRESVGAPVSNPPTPEERQDFQVLAEALAKAYKPYLTDQLASVEYPAGIPDEVLAGNITSTEGQADICAIFERLLTTDAAQALVGKAAFAESSRNPNVRLCRCWCVSAICFGCCLARARGLEGARRCLEAYYQSLRNCFQPLTCQLTAPTGCVQETAFPSVLIFRGVEIFGTATGLSCNHYVLQWRQDGVGPWQSGGIVYPGGAAQGTCGVVGGILGYLSTFPLVAAGLVEIQLCVHSSQPSESPCCVTIEFELQRNLVWIQGIEGINAATPPGVFDPTAQLVDGSGAVRSFGTALRIFGSAVVGGCSGLTIKRYTLSYQPGFTTTTAGAWTQFWQVNYNTPFQIDSGLNNVFEQALTNQWLELPMSFFDPFPFPGHTVCSVAGDYTNQAYWDTQNPQGGYAVQYPSPPAVCNEAATSTWNSTPLALPNCQSGRYTLRLTAQDTGGNTTDDLQQVWFDNKQIYGSIAQIGTIPACATIELSAFAVGAGDCSVAWPAPLEGVAYDEYIEEGNFSAPSDNFGGYSLEIMKAGGGWHSLTIPGPDSPPFPPVLPPWSGPYVGTTRVGDPGTRCATAVPSPGPIPPFTNGILALLDMRRLDSVCNPYPADADLVLKRATISPSGQPLAPGDCCGFIVHLAVWDTSICPSLSGGRHQVDVYFPFCICNDLPPVVVP